MDVKEAVAKAREYLSLVFSDEPISEIRLEEVEFDRVDEAWLITFGLVRPNVAGKVGQIAALTAGAPYKRSYKIVRVPNSGDGVPSIKIREFAEE
ncbi:hypothetical protein [Methylobacterium oxalidis]|uniref:Uncharacterized protein n=1 Tax=Methylobacterium oxalidis TaxID=944322 RepID=A0A512IXZ6_9HYPH|nr:hypothetical protein [Methylobacterium oxalidis]GEP02565.1 hypothetical protein MOX02_06030 [Methylobacterium oxalidis]GJE32623.1 hypothetical protein LDDCCGHA_2811 [Methylobacterium oxalidis]GLS61774.1 hypothetical protein GCM10007888_01550 [Methylobacterium oxalidis]